jgi:cellular nucleic acid-binding protein
VVVEPVRCSNFHLFSLVLKCITANGNCFNCGQPGHRKIDCPAPIQQQLEGGFRSNQLFGCVLEICDSINILIRSASGGNCFNCGQPGHRKMDCPSLATGESTNSSAFSGGFRSSGSSGACFNCGQTGHRKADCPSAAAGGSRPPIVCFKLVIELPFC